MTRLPRPGARDCDAGRTTPDGRERSEPERDEPGEEPRGDRERHASQPHEAEAEPDAGQRRQRQSGQRGLGEAGAGPCPQQGRGKSSDRHERALAERRHPPETEREREPSRGQGEIEPAGEILELKRVRHERRYDKGKREPQRRQRGRQAPGAANVVRGARESAPSLGHGFGHSSSGSRVRPWTATTMSATAIGSTSRYSGPRW